MISYLASGIERETMAEMGRTLNESLTQQFTMRTWALVTAFFDGFTLLAPGLVRTHEWRLDLAAEAEIPSVFWARNPQGQTRPVWPTASRPAGDTGCRRDSGVARR